MLIDDQASDHSHTAGDRGSIERPVTVSPRLILEDLQDQDQISGTGHRPVTPLAEKLGNVVWESCKLSVGTCGRSLTDPYNDLGATKRSETYSRAVK